MAHAFLLYTVNLSHFTNRIHCYNVCRHITNSVSDRIFHLNAKRRTSHLQYGVTSPMSSHRRSAGHDTGKTKQLSVSSSGCIQNSTCNVLICIQAREYSFPSMVTGFCVLTSTPLVFSHDLVSW